MSEMFNVPDALSPSSCGLDARRDMFWSKLKTVSDTDLESYV